MFEFKNKCMGKTHNMEHDFKMVKFNYNTGIIGLKINIESYEWDKKSEIDDERMENGLNTIWTNEIINTIYTMYS